MASTLVGSEEVTLILECPNGEKGLARIPRAVAVSILKPEYSSAVLTPQSCRRYTGGRAKKKLSSLEREASKYSKLLCISPVYSLFEGVTYFLC